MLFSNTCVTNDNTLLDRVVFSDLLLGLDKKKQNISPFVWSETLTSLMPRVLLHGQLAAIVAPVGPVSAKTVANTRATRTLPEGASQSKNDHSLLMVLAASRTLVP